jgi:hypothetical protein
MAPPERPIPGEGMGGESSNLKVQNPRKIQHSTFKPGGSPVKPDVGTQKNFVGV